MAVAIGIDVGGSKLLARAVGDGSTQRLQRPTGRATDPESLLVAIGEVVRELGGEGEGRAVGIGFPGLVDVEGGVVRSSVMLDGWRDVPLAAMVQAATGLPCTVDNDVHAAAIAELDARQDAPPTCMVLVAVGTGIGGAIAFGGKLWRGVAGVAGEIGNMTIAHGGERCWCGRRGCLNTLCSGEAIERRLGLAPGELARVSMRPEVTLVLDQAAEHLATGLVDVLHLLGPDLLVLAGGVLELGAPFLAKVRAGVERQAFPEALAACRIEPARTGYDAAALGAGLLALGAAEGAPR